MVKVVRLYSGDDGQSHFEEVEVSLNDAGIIGGISDPVNVSNALFHQKDGDDIVDWHNAPQAQYVIVLSGAAKIEVGDGTERIFQPGEVILAEDTTGQGHRTSPHGGHVASMIVPIDR